VTGREFLRKIQKLAKERQTSMTYDAALGKESHGRVFFGSSFTILKDPKKEIGAGLLSKMCRDLGVKPSDL